eukprot:13242110-Ditylum_brightwellii.AAC.2
MLEALQQRSGSSGTPVAFSLAFDATKVAPVVELSAGYECIIGGKSPLHMIPIKGRSLDKVEKILGGKHE